MKKYFGFFLCLFVAMSLLSSCNKESEDDDMDEYMEQTDSTSNGVLGGDPVEDFPAAIVDYINLNFPGIEIDEVYLNEDGTFEVELEGDIYLLFDALGEFLQMLEDDDEDDEDEEDDDDEDDDE